MPVIEQQGQFVAGTFGFTIEGDLSPLVTNIFANVTTAKIDLYRPDGTKVLDRTLPLPSAIVDVNGKIQFVVQNGDLTMAGVYSVRFKLDYSGGAHLEFGGDFVTSEE